MAITLLDGLPARGRYSSRAVRVAIGLLILLVIASIGTLFPPLHVHTEGTVGYEILLDTIYLLAAGIVAARVWVVRDGRLAWGLLATGLLLYGLGNVVYYAVVQDLEPEPFPSIADGLWLPLYPLLYAAAVLLVRRQMRQWHASQWLDGLVAALGIAAVVAEFVLTPVINSTSGSPAAVVVNLMYPAADLLLLMLVVTVFAVNGWRPGATWWLLGTGMATFALADVVYLVQLSRGTAQPGLWVDDVWLIGLVAMALAPWITSRRVASAQSRAGLRLLAVPMVFAASSLGLLLTESLDPRGSLPVALLAIATIIVALLRTSLSFREVRALGDAQRLARTDDLTGLGNRRRFIEQLDLMSAGRAARPAAVLLIDLDRFKEVNDSFGHHVGDDLLRLVSARLQKAVPPRGVLARLGGDEFALLVPDADVPVALAAAETIKELLAAPFSLEGLLLQVDGSIGIALSPEHGTSSSMLLRHADIAMYEAKKGRVPHAVFDEARHGGARQRLETIAQFRTAIDAGELVLHYQPQVSLRTHQVVAVEALLRWQHPQQGMVYPDTFLPLAEQAGLMDRVIDQVLALALGDLSRWRRQVPDLAVAVNLSASNLQDELLPDVVTAHLRAADLPASALTLEITENVLMADAEKAQSVLLALRRLGVVLSVDDYGTGYCSLGYLRDLPVDELKLDRSFVSDASHDPRSAAIVRCTIDLARELGLRMVAEGVEDAGVLERLRDWGCDVVQGYHVGRPMPAGNVMAWLDAHATRRSTPVKVLRGA